MTIVPLAGAPPPAARAAARRAGGVFTVPEEAPTAQAAGEAEPVTALSLAGMLSLQEIEPGAERDRRARRHAEDILAELRGLQLDHLGAAPDPDRLARLARLAGTVPEAASPGLREAMRSVAVRAAVELARLEMRRAAIAARNLG